MVRVKELALVLVSIFMALLPLIGCATAMFTEVGANVLSNYRAPDYIAKPKSGAFLPALGKTTNEKEVMNKVHNELAALLKEKGVNPSLGPDAFLYSSDESLRNLIKNLTDATLIKEAGKKMNVEVILLCEVGDWLMNLPNPAGGPSHSITLTYTMFNAKTGEISAKITGNQRTASMVPVDLKFMHDVALGLSKQLLNKL